MHMATKFGKSVTYLDGHWLIKSMTLWSRNLARSRNKVKTYFRYQSTYGHQTWYDGSLPRGVSTHKVIWCFHHFVFESAYNDKTWQNFNLPWLAPTHKVNNPLITWSCKIAWQIKNIFPLPQCLWPPNLAG